MKNVKLILASFCLVLVGCSDDDDPASSTSYTLSGTFNATSMTMYMTEDCSGDGMTGMCMDGVSADEAACTEAGASWMSYSDMLGDMSVTFNADGTFTTSEYPEETLTYTCSSATSCSSDGVTFTVNSDGTVTSSAGSAAYCTDEDDEAEYDTYTTQEDCEANGSAADAADGVWYDASCSATVWTAATGS